MNDDYLSALALLKTASDEHGANYLDYVTPFVADAIRSSGKNSLQANEIRSAVLKSYGLDVPDGVINTITKRLTRKQLGKRSHGRFKPDIVKLASTYNFDSQRNDINDRIVQLTANFIDFADRTFGRRISETEANRTLTTYADQNGLSIIRTAYDRRGKHQVKRKLPTSLSLKEEEYIVSRYVVSAFENDQPEMETMIMLAKGSKLASVLYLPDPQDVSRNITDLTALVDTPTLLSALGYQGRTQEEAARTILDIAYEIGIDLAVFDHTVDEMKSVLQAAASTLGRRAHPRRGARAVEKHFLQLNRSPSDVELLVGQLEQDLRSLRVSMLERPEIRIEWTLDEATLEEKLQQNVRYPRREPMLHDLDALTAIFRLRGGRTPRRFETCRAIFITSNAPLVRTARDFFKRQVGDHWPVAITEDNFATLVWLKRPLKAPELPMRRVIADAYAALEPGLVSWETYLTEIDKLRTNERISEEDYFFLRYSSAVKDTLMDEALGDLSGISPGDVETLLEEFKASIRSPLEQEVEQQSKAFQDYQNEAAARQSLLERQLKVSESSRMRARDDAEIAKEALANHRKAARSRAARRSRHICRFGATIAVLVLTLGIWFSLPNTWGLSPDQLSSWGRWIARISILTVGMATLASFCTGWQLVHHKRRVEVALSKWIERRYLRRYFGLTDEEPI